MELQIRPASKTNSNGVQAVTPDTLRYLLHDLFAVNTFWVLKTVCRIEGHLTYGRIVV